MKIEQQMLEAVEKAHYDYGEAVGGSEDFFIAEAVAKIALDLAFKALKEGNRYQEDMSQELQERAFKQFIQDYTGE